MSHDEPQPQNQNVNGSRTSLNNALNLKDALENQQKALALPKRGYIKVRKKATISSSILFNAQAPINIRTQEFSAALSSVAILVKLRFVCTRFKHGSKGWQEHDVAYLWCEGMMGAGLLKGMARTQCQLITPKGQRPSPQNSFFPKAIVSIVAA
eukprot:1150117-Pelagomonas_calceolata.AAC.5